MHMKKILILISLLVFAPGISDSLSKVLVLRSSHHLNYLRLVLEGDIKIIGEASVFQRGGEVVVTLPESGFSVYPENMIIPYRRENRNTIVFSPKKFRGLKVFTLKKPDRLVIDVYSGEMKEQILSRALFNDRDKKDHFKIQSVVIDPGHGGYDFGLSDDQNSEKNIVLDIAKRLNLLLKGKETDGFLTRGSDRFMTLSERADFTNDKETDVFISIHIGNHDDVVLYVPVITEHVSDVVRPYLKVKGQAGHLKDSVSLINAMKEAVISEFGDDMVTIRSLPYSILSKIEAAAILVELPSFQDAQYADELKKEIADTLYKGLHIYEKNKAG